MALYDYQRPHAEVIQRALETHGVALDTSDTGTGKTHVACDVLKRFKCKVGVVCPKVLIPTWENTLKEYGITSVFVLSYQKLRGGRTKWATRRPGRSKIFDWKLPKGTCLIFDEVHHCKSDSSLQAGLLIGAREQNIPRLLLSATALSSLLHMKAIGHSLNMFPRSGYFKWLIRKGARKGRFGGFEFPAKKNTDVLLEVHNYVFPEYGSRMRVADLGDRFPKGVVTSDVYQVSDSKKIARLYESIAEKAVQIQEKLADTLSTLTEILYERQQIELLKLPTMAELAKDALSEGYSVVIFLNFRESITQMSQILGTDCIVQGTRGKSDDANRQKNIEDFQSNRSRVILVGVQAGGAGLSLHDEHGGHPRVSLISPSYSAQDLIQCLGRIHRANSQSPAVQHIVYAAGTVEEKIAASVRKKINQMDLLTDGELRADLF